MRMAGDWDAALRVKGLGLSPLWRLAWTAIPTVMACDATKPPDMYVASSRVAVNMTTSGAMKRQWCTCVRRTVRRSDTR
tara:strand:- start:783 stop:1019 length:237 start_codon:yes stop_codon:yes gene_type:complete